MKTPLKTFIFFIVLVSSIFLVQNLVTLPKISQPPTEVEKNQEIQPGIVVNLKLDFGNGNVKIFNDIKLGEEKTVFALLKKITQENNMEFSFKEYPDLGAFVESIDNVANNSENNQWWQYWVNNEYAQLGASLYKLKEGDLIEWKYVEGQF